MYDEPFPGALNTAREAARLVRSLDLEGMSTATAAIRELQQQHVITVDAVGVRKLLDDWRKTQGLMDTSELVEAMREMQGLNIASESAAALQVATGITTSLPRLREMFAAPGIREAMETVHIGSKWREQVRETMEVLGASTALTEQMRKALAQRQTFADTFTITPVFEAALTEAETLAADVEAPAVEARAPFENLTDAQRAALQVTLLGAMSEIAANIAFFLGSRRADAAAHLLALLVVLVTIYRQVRPPE